MGQMTYVEFFADISVLRAPEDANVVFGMSNLQCTTAQTSWQILIKFDIWPYFGSYWL